MKKIVFLSLLLLASVSYARSPRPYQPDAHTLYLWNMDVSSVPVPDAMGNLSLAGMANDATLGYPSYPGFGTALSTFDGGPTAILATDKDAYLSALPLVNGDGDNVSMTLADPVTGAFTYEAIVKVEFDPTLHYGTLANGGNGRGSQFMMIAGENEEATLGRIFQFRIEPIGTAGTPLNTEVLLKFINVNHASNIQHQAATIPTTGPHAIAMDNWYHAAVTYDGNEGSPDNCKLYWTNLDAEVDAANLIASTTMATDLPISTTDFAIGNTGRNPPNANFPGLIDEVRISRSARSPEDMIFQDPLPTPTPFSGIKEDLIPYE